MMPWIMTQTWYGLLFAHWPVPAAQLRPLIPPPLQLDTYDGEAWLAVVPFGMRDIRVRGLPAVPYLSHFPEINVRTYVVHDGKPGVWFLSLDVPRTAAVWAARTFFHLPYYRANICMKMATEGGSVAYESERMGLDGRKRHFRGTYRPVSEVCAAAAGTLEYWLTERYCLYTAHRSRVYRGDIMHRPWPLQLAEADIEANAMAPDFAASIKGTKPLLHYADRLSTRICPLVRVT